MRAAITAITGSKLHRVWKCPASAVLPQVATDEPSPAADRGRQIHRFLERCRVDGLDVAIAEADEDLRPLLACLDLDELPTHLATEVAFAYDWRARTARELGRNISRAYGALPSTIAPIGATEIPFTIDLVGGETREGVRRGYVGDYKSGWSRYPAPDQFAQTLIAGLAVRAVYECDEVVLELLYIRSDGDHWRARRTVDGWDLDTFADQIERAMDAVELAAAEYAAGRGVDVNEGPHCDFCPAYKQCPAKIALVRALPAELAKVGITSIDGEWQIGPLTRPRLAAAWMVLERIDEVIRRAKAEICGVAAFEPIDLPDGRVIETVTTERESLDGKVAAAVLEQWYGREAVDEAATISMSKDALRTAVVARKKDGEVIASKKGTGILDRILAEIRRRDGIETTTSISVRPHVPKRLKAGA